MNLILSLSQISQHLLRKGELCRSLSGHRKDPHYTYFKGDINPLEEYLYYGISKISGATETILGHQDVRKDLYYSYTLHAVLYKEL